MAALIQASCRSPAMKRRSSVSAFGRSSKYFAPFNGRSAGRRYAANPGNTTAFLSTAHTLRIAATALISTKRPGRTGVRVIVGVDGPRSVRTGPGDLSPTDMAHTAFDGEGAAAQARPRQLLPILPQRQTRRSGRPHRHPPDLTWRSPWQGSDSSRARWHCCTCWRWPAASR